MIRGSACTMTGVSGSADEPQRTKRHHFLLLLLILNAQQLHQVGRRPGGRLGNGLQANRRSEMRQLRQQRDGTERAVMYPRALRGLGRSGPLRRALAEAQPGRARLLLLLLLLLRHHGRRGRGRSAAAAHSRRRRKRCGSAAECGGRSRGAGRRTHTAVAHAGRRVQLRGVAAHLPRLSSRDMVFDEQQAEARSKARTGSLMARRSAMGVRNGEPEPPEFNRRPAAQQTSHEDRARQIETQGRTYT